MVSNEYIAYTIEKLGTMDELPMVDATVSLMKNIAKQLANAYDALIFAQLYCYGINLYNYKNQIGRIYVINQPNYHHYFVDGMYAFSAYMGGVNWDESGLKASIYIDTMVINSMVGMSVTDYTLRE